jgi:molybdopterin-guanine dinucleotide biosynthesis protein A
VLGTVDGPVFVAATDLPLLDPATVEAMIGLAVSAAGIDAVVARSDRLEPLCAIWLPGAAPVLGAAFAAGERSVRRALESLTFATYDVEPATVRNVNRPEDVPGPAPLP